MLCSGVDFRKCASELRFFFFLEVIAVFQNGCNCFGADGELHGVPAGGLGKSLKDRGWDVKQDTAPAAAAAAECVQNRPLYYTAL